MARAAPAGLRPRPGRGPDGKNDTQPHRQRYLCHECRKRFDDLTGNIFAGHHQPLRTWIICLYFMGLNFSTLQIAKELDIHRSDAQAVVQSLRQEVVDRRPAVALEGEVECDEVYVVAGHKGASKNKAALSCGSFF